MFGVFVGGLGSATEAQVREVFEQFGAIESVKIIREGGIGQPKGYGFVNFCDEESQRKALNFKEGLKGHGSTWFVRKGHTSVAKDQLTCLHVTGFPETWNKQKIKNFVTEQTGLEVLNIGQQGLKTTFSLRRCDVPKAVQTFNGTVVEGRQLNVEAATSKAHRHQNITFASLLYELALANGITPLLDQQQFYLLEKSLRTLYVGNITQDVTELEIASCFREYGTLEDVSLVLNLETGEHRGFAFVVFNEHKTCEEVLSADKFYSINGNIVKVQNSKPPKAVAELAKEAGLYDIQGQRTPLLEQLMAAARQQVELMRRINSGNHVDPVTAIRTRLLAARPIACRTVPIENPSKRNSQIVQGQGQYVQDPNTGQLYFMSSGLNQIPAATQTVAALSNSFPATTAYIQPQQLMAPYGAAMTYNNRQLSASSNAGTLQNAGALFGTDSRMQQLPGLTTFSAAGMQQAMFLPQMMSQFTNPLVNPLVVRSSTQPLQYATLPSPTGMPVGIPGLGSPMGLPTATATSTQLNTLSTVQGVQGVQGVQSVQGVHQSVQSVQGVQGMQGVQGVPSVKMENVIPNVQNVAQMKPGVKMEPTQQNMLLAQQNLQQQKHVQKATTKPSPAPPPAPQMAASAYGLAPQPNPNGPGQAQNLLGGRQTTSRYGNARFAPY